MLRLLNLAAEALGKELNSGESRLWLQCFQFQEPAALEWAFAEFFKGNLTDQYGNVSGNFFPRTGQIAQLLDRYYQRRADERRDQEQKKYLDELRAARKQLEAEGKPVGLAQVHALLKEACERVKRMP